MNGDECGLDWDYWRRILAVWVACVGDEAGPAEKLFGLMIWTSRSRSAICLCAIEIQPDIEGEVGF